jgi:hypothetical protein
MKNAPVTSASVSSAKPATMLWKQPDSIDSSGVSMRSQPSGRRRADGQEREGSGGDGDVEREFPARPADVVRACTLREGRLEHRRDQQQQRRSAPQAGLQGHQDRRDGDHQSDERRGVAHRQRGPRLEAVLVEQRCRVDDHAHRGDRERRDAPAATAVGIGPVGGDAEPDGSDQVTDDGDQVQRQAGVRQGVRL